MPLKIELRNPTGCDTMRDTVYCAFYAAIAAQYGTTPKLSDIMRHAPELRAYAAQFGIVTVKPHDTAQLRYIAPRFFSAITGE